MKQRESNRGDRSPSLDQPRVLVAVCTLNEAENIVRLLQKLSESLPSAELLVIDDHSPDDTALIASKAFVGNDNVSVVVRRQERGLGSAIRHAMRVAVDGDFDLFMNLDADFSHDPAQLPDLLQAAIAHPEADVVIGSRYVAGGEIVGWPLKRRIMSRAINRFATLGLRLPVKDCSGSMRCYRVSALQRIGVENLRIDGYAVLEEVLMSLHRNGSTFVEVPITFTERERGKSKLSLKEAARAVRQLVWLAIRR